jgi:alkylation response protein AidB-like acyl-CoA dehydrogenase
MSSNEGRQVLQAVRDIVPVLRKNGQQADENGWIPEENITLLEAAGVFKMAVPRRFGGLELPLAEQIAVITEVASGCGSTGWVAGVYQSSGWAVTLYPDKAQEEVFKNGSVRVSIGFAPTGTIKKVDGGYVLNGTWRFNSGVKGAEWNFNAAMLDGPDGPEEVLALVPVSELSFVDEWDVAGGSGTGSITSIAKDVFVPDHRVVGFEHIMESSTPGRTNGGADGRNYALMALVLAGGTGTFIGIAKGAYEMFLERVPGRGITYTPWTDQTQHPITQVQVANAKNKIDAAVALSREYIQVLQDRADAGEQPTVEEKAIIRGQTAFGAQLAKEAVDILFNLSGGSVIQRSVPMQRFHRDIQAFSLHALVQVNVNLEVQGRVLLGLDPNTPYV